MLVWLFHLTSSGFLLAILFHSLSFRYTELFNAGGAESRRGPWNPSACSASVFVHTKQTHCKNWTVKKNYSLRYFSGSWSAPPWATLIGQTHEPVHFSKNMKEIKGWQFEIGSVCNLTLRWRWPSSHEVPKNRDKPEWCCMVPECSLNFAISKRWIAVTATAAFSWITAFA